MCAFVANYIYAYVVHTPYTFSFSAGKLELELEESQITIGNNNQLLRSNVVDLKKQTSSFLKCLHF